MSSTGSKGCNCNCAGVSESSSEGVVTAVQEHYGKVATAARGGQTNSCGVSDKLYEVTKLESLTAEAVASSAGCGNPLGLADAKDGETVLDLGSGGGIDCFLAAKEVGERGQVIGVDVTDKMVDLARQNASKMGVSNVVFKLGRIEAIPVQDATVDLAISNCVISLSEDKSLVFDEIFRVLKPGARMIISDMVFEGEPPSQLRSSLASWVECIGGADVKKKYLERIEKAGFEQIELLDERVTGSEELGGSAEAGALVLSVTIKAHKPSSN